MNTTLFTAMMSTLTGTILYCTLGSSALTGPPAFP